MNVTSMTGFLQSLTNKTLSGEIKWECLSELQHVSTDENESLHYALFQNEYHRVTIYNSFFCELPKSGFVYLIEETIDSGRFNYVATGPNVYVQKDFSSKMYKLTVDLSFVYQLQNAINATYSERNKAIQDFIDDFFND